MRMEVESFTLAHLPIVKEYAYRMGLVEIVDRTLPGKILLGLIMNILCGRLPLYRVEEFFRTRDVTLLLGEGLTRAFDIDIIMNIFLQYFHVNPKINGHMTGSPTSFGSDKPDNGAANDHCGPLNNAIIMLGGGRDGFRTRQKT